jgi:hypothetical protein
MARIVLVSCSKSKLPTAAAAADLYGPSSTFRAARAYAERHGSAWYILSAKHGLVHPAQRLAPYEYTLLGADQDTAESWGADVAARLEQLTAPGDEIVLLAARVYGSWWVTRLRRLGRKVETPLYGLSVGRIKGWLKGAAR